MAQDQTAVRLWTVEVDSVPHERALRLLSGKEQERAAALSSERVRRRFVSARAALRAALAEVTGAEPASLLLTQGTHGKPQLADGAPVGFNVSHSGALALVAVAAEADVGVDVERVRPRARLDAIARRCFSAVELEALAGSAEPDRLALFHATWTAREAFVKATGRGLAAATDSFEIPPWPAGLKAPVPVPEAGLPGPRLSLLRLAPAEGYSGALVASGAGWQVEHHALPAALAGP